MKKITKKIIIILILCYLAIADASNFKQKIFGVDGDLLKNIKSRLEINRQSFDDNLDKNQLNEYQQASLQEIKNALATYGYFNPGIKSSVTQKNGVITIQYFITPGKPLHIRHLDFQIKGDGICDEAFQDLIANLPLEEGDVLISKNYQQAKTALVDLAAQRGYFSAQIEKSTILVDLRHYSADVIIHFSTGPRYFMGPLIFSSSPFCEQFLKRFAPFKFGDPYNNDMILRFQENLSSSHYFQQVLISPKPEQAQNCQVPIYVEIIPRKALQYSLGTGYGTDTGVRALAGLQLRRINGMGHHLEMILQASEKQNHLETSYMIPGRDPVTDFYKLSAALEQQNLETSGKTRNEKIEASYVSLFYRWQQTLSLSLRDEHSEPIDAPVVNSTMLLPNINWLLVKTDNPLHPNCGYRISLNFRGATRLLISNTDFLQGELQAKTIIPFSHATRLILRGDIGYTIIPDVEELPITLQFYAGGAQSVRGYQFQEIGPGRNIVVGSIELQQRIKGSIYGAIFMDVGNVSNGLIDHLKKGVGIGLVWRSPIGAIEVTLAQALDNPGHPRLLQFSMGPEL